MIKLLRPAFGAALLLLVPAIAMAQSAPAPADAAKADGDSRLAACRADVDTLCPGATKGDRRKCLQDNSAKLSAACKTAISEMAAKSKAMREACAADIKSHCAGIDSADGKLAQCLRTNIAKMSADCGAAIKARFPKG